MAGAVEKKIETVVIRQAEYYLKAGTFRLGCHHLIQAETVHIEKGFVNPGCDLTLMAAQVLVAAEGATIDVSGTDAVNRPDNVAHNSGTGYKNNAGDGADGRNGADGIAGQHSGKIIIYADTIEGGELNLLAKGGKGGKPESGGHGMKGLDLGADKDQKSKPPVPTMQIVGSHTVVVDNPRGAPIVKVVNDYGWGSDVSTIGEGKLGNYLRVSISSAHGDNGGNGGNAGLAGTPGKGGDGGVIRLLNNLSRNKINKNFSGGAAGDVARHGDPGHGGSAQQGAKYLYATSIGLNTLDWAAFDENQALQDLWTYKDRFMEPDHFSNLSVKSAYIVTNGSEKKLKLRADPGNAGNRGGYGAAASANPPAIATAKEGGKGSFDTISTASLDAEIPYSYLLMLVRCAKAAVLSDDTERARRILRWLVTLTGKFAAYAKNLTEDQRNRRQILLEAEQALATLGNKAARQTTPCPYTDIKAYSSYVKDALAHYKDKENYAKEFAAEKRTLEKSKKTLAEALADARKFNEHLTGDTDKPGSLKYLREKELQLKSTIGELRGQIHLQGKKLQDMPGKLQQAIDAQFRAKTRMDFWSLVEVMSMVAGVAMSFASAGSSLAGFFGKVKDFYKQSQELTTLKDILQKGIFSKDVLDLKDDIAKLMKTDEWKEAKKLSAEFIDTVIDMQVRLKAAEKLYKDYQQVEFTLNETDLLTDNLVFDGARLELKKHRNEFKAYIVQFLQEYKEAQEWKHAFNDYFDMSSTHLDLLMHLTTVKADRRELEFKKRQCEESIKVLSASLEELSYDPALESTQDIQNSLDNNLQLAINFSLQLIQNEARAYEIWTLESYELPNLPKNLSEKYLSDELHQPLWEKISNRLSSAKTPARRDFSDTPVVWKRVDYPKLFEEFASTGRISLTVSPDLDSDIYFERLIDAKIYLRGAKVKEGSEFHCVLKHSGISQFLSKRTASNTKQQRIKVCYQEPAGTTFSYKLITNGSSQEPTYDYKNAIINKFDGSEKMNRIRYSPYTTWQLIFQKDYRLNTNSIAYNQELDLSKLEAIELRYEVFFENR